MLRAIVDNNGAHMEIEVGQENIGLGDVKVEKVIYMQGSPISLLYFSDKGVPVTDAARFDVQKSMFIDASPLKIQEGDANDTKLHLLGRKVNQAWNDAARQITPQTPEVEFVTPAGLPFSNFGTPQP